MEWPPLVVIAATNGQKCRWAVTLGSMTDGATRRNRRFAFLGVIAAGLVLSACAGASDGQVPQVAATPEPVAGALTQATPTPRGAMSDEGIVTVGLTDPYTPTSTGAATDDYRCFLLDLGLEDDRMVTGVRFVPRQSISQHTWLPTPSLTSRIHGKLKADSKDTKHVNTALLKH